MSQVANSNAVFGSALKLGQKTIQIQSLSQDIRLTNELNEFRLKNGFSSVRNSLPWWKAALVAATYFDGGFSFQGVRAALGYVEFRIASAGSTLLKNAALQTAPSTVRREYTKSLPTVARRIKLKYLGVSESDGRGRPSSQFKLQNPDAARAWLLKEFPETACLFSTLDKCLQ